MKRLWPLWLLLAGTIGLATALQAQAVSDRPMLNFRLPLFNEFGDRIWDLRAAAVRQLSASGEQRFELTGIHVQMLAGDDAGTVEAELFAPQAVVDLVDQNARTISGEGQLHIVGRGVELFGFDWVYHADEETVVIQRDVLVTFTGDLGNLLR